MKIAVISDLHGNLEAFHAFLDSVGDFSVCVCLGDLVDYGPDPRGVIKGVQEIVNFIVRGNHDHAAAFNVDCGCSYLLKDLSVKTREYMSTILDQPDLNYLKTLPTEKYLNFDGRRTFVVHAGKDDIYRYIKPTARDVELEYEFDDTRSDLVFSGHSHVPVVRKLKNFTFVNPGSLGQPRDGDPRASFAMINGDKVEIKRVEYDIEKEAAKIRATTLEDKVKDRLVEILKTGSIVNGEASLE